jgi:hypothetical protein
MTGEQEIALMRFVQDSIGRPFAWGRCDCNVYALEAIDATHGTDLASLISGRYSTGLGAIRYRKRCPWGSFIGLLAEHGFVEAKKGFEQTGDLLVIPDPRWEMVHVYLGRDAVSVSPDLSVCIFPMASIRHETYLVWRLPCQPQ